MATTSKYRWRCPLCGWITPWRDSEEALRVERYEHCENRHDPDREWTAYELSASRWDTD